MEWPILQDLCETDRARVLAATARRSYERDEMIVHQGDSGSAFHLLARGRVAVRVSTLEGEVVTLSVLGPGDFFGEQALLGRGTNAPRPSWRSSRSRPCRWTAFGSTSCDAPTRP